MDKFKTTIYVPIGYHNNDLTSEAQLARYVQRLVPREFRVVQVIDTFIDTNHSALTVEVEKAINTIEVSWLKAKLEEKIKASRSERFKQSMKELIEEIEEELKKK